MESESCLPKCASPGGHDEDWNPGRVGEVVENPLSTGRRTVTVDSVERYVLFSKVPLDEIQSVCPTREYYTVKVIRIKILQVRGIVQFTFWTAISLLEHLRLEPPFWRNGPLVAGINRFAFEREHQAGLPKYGLR